MSGRIAIGAAACGGADDRVALATAAIAGPGCTGAVLTRDRPSS